MLTVLIGTDWVANTDAVLQRVARDVQDKRSGIIYIVPELISHDMERRLCMVAGDTSSRYAEILSFSRLARRVAEYTGHGIPACMDSGGRVVAMAAAARQLHSKLKAYASVETKPEFLTGLLDAVDEFKRCCITPEDLQAASKKTHGSLAQKLEELSLLLEAYDALCAQGKLDPRDQMTWLLEQLEDSDFAENHRFYVDGFPDYTRQHMAILEHMIARGAHVVVSVNCDKPDSRALAFEKAGATASYLIRCAKRHEIPVETVMQEPRNLPLAALGLQLYQGSIQMGNLADFLQVIQADSVYGECLDTAEQILSLVASGCRYRDISVVCTDMDTYRNVLEMVLQRCRIPVYLSGTEQILEKSVITTVLAAMDAALGGFNQKEVLRYIKSVLSPLTLPDCDQLEEYVLIWNIKGNKWLQKWTGHPEGLKDEWTDGDRAKLDQLNEYRALAVDPLKHLRDGFRKAVSMADQIQALYQFMEEIELADRLGKLADQMDEQGDHRGAQILNQLWEILIGALEQLYEVLGRTAWDEDAFLRLLKLLLSQYDVGTIPSVLDSVMVGPVSAMRCQRSRHLFVLGALEGNLPGYSGSTGVLSDQERTELRNLGVPLTGGAMEGLQAEFAEIYGVFCGAEQSVRVSCPAGQPSFLFRRLADMAGGVQKSTAEMGAALTDPMEAAAYLVRRGAEDAAKELNLEASYAEIRSRRDYTLGTVQRSHIDGLYGKSLFLSASQIDLQAQCRLAYFLNYGLKVRERKTAEINPAEFGSYVHAVLEQTGRRIMESGGFHDTSLEDAMQIAESFARDYAGRHFIQLDSERLTYLFRRNDQELQCIVRELWEEMQHTAFAPSSFELGFGTQDGLPAISVPGKTMDAKLRGYVDRVDSWLHDGNRYFRVVDYKTGKKDFDYCDVFNGLGLQMLLYLFSLRMMGQPVLGDYPICAGVQYFPARAPLISVDGVLTDKEAAEERIKSWRRKGLLLNDEAVLRAMEDTDEPVRMSYKYNKEGEAVGDLASREQLKMLQTYVFRVVGRMVDDIASGCVEPNPYTRGESHNACRYCPYQALCHPANVPGRRNYKAMTAKQFWEEIEKELKNRG